MLDIREGLFGTAFGSRHSLGNQTLNTKPYGILNQINQKTTLHDQENLSAYLSIQENNQQLKSKYVNIIQDNLINLHELPQQVKDLDDFLAQSGKIGDWDTEDHEDFLSVLHVCQNDRTKIVKMLQARLGRYYTKDVIIQHIEWYQRYQYLAQEKRLSMQNWRQQLQEQDEINQKNGSRNTSLVSDNMVEKGAFLMDTYVQQQKDQGMISSSLSTSSSQDLKVQVMPDLSMSNSNSDESSSTYQVANLINPLRSVHIERLKKIQQGHRRLQSVNYVEGYHNQEGNIGSLQNIESRSSSPKPKIKNAQKVQYLRNQGVREISDTQRLPLNRKQNYQNVYGGGDYDSFANKWSCTPIFKSKLKAI